MLFKRVFNFIVSRQYACISLKSAPQRRSLAFVAFSSLCALGLFILICFDSLDLDFDFSVPVLDTKNTEGVLHPKADVCNFDYSSIEDIVRDRSKPYISFFVDNELVVKNKKIALENAFIGKQICIIIMIPDSITNNSDDFSNKNIYARVLSNNVYKIIPVVSVPNYENFYKGIGILYYPDDYSLSLTIELPGRKDITIMSENILRLSLNEEAFRKEPNELLPICNATSEITGQWVSGYFYDSLRPLTRHSEFLDIDNEFIFIPDQCRMKLITPAEQLLLLEKKIIHAYGDTFLWGSLYGIENGYKLSWCEEKEQKLILLCSCNFPKPLLSKDTQFVNISSSVFESSLFFHPIDDLLGRKILWKVALKQTSRIPKADIVIISVSNNIFMDSSKSLQDFRIKLKGLLLNIKEIYPDSDIYVRTPEPFSLSRHIPDISRIRYLQTRDVTINVTREIGLYLWDVGIFDGKDWYMPDQCVKKSKDQLWFKRDVVKLESQLLFHSYHNFN
ncbi:hypothetical protein RclHR1_11690006 [Rhizophagus clarus]|uniref:Uncharacterized protein n=1 Tax=Rhizophagus clarus TaxID=94130 RepID=A0A2Z6QH76_9GLOM|nr:hypothetical protein RclHR1_11690006 [Rhizophagus clarus]GES77041.1 hypothetical protein GLOIN_2v1624340 [Rhizophagus clarus]